MVFGEDYNGFAWWEYSLGKWTHCVVVQRKPRKRYPVRGIWLRIKFKDAR